MILSHEYHNPTAAHRYRSARNQHAGARAQKQNRNVVYSYLFIYFFFRHRSLFDNDDKIRETITWNLRNDAVVFVDRRIWKQTRVRENFQRKPNVCFGKKTRCDPFSIIGVSIISLRRHVLWFVIGFDLVRKRDATDAIQ